MTDQLLTILVFLPLLGALCSIFFKNGNTKLIQTVSIVFGGSTLLLAVYILTKFDPANASLQFVEKVDWIGGFNIKYSIGVNGLSLPLILVSALLFLMAYIYPSEGKFGSKGFYSFMLFLETAVIGLFVSQDLFLFFTFWLLTIIPMYFLVAIWGHENKDTAATGFFSMQLFGTLILILSILAVYYGSDVRDFSIEALSGNIFKDKTYEIAGKSLSFESLVFSMMMIAFFMRLPVVPLHHWMREFLVEAPASVAALASSVFALTGAYGLIHVAYKLFPAMALKMSDVIAIVGVVSMLYSGLCAVAARDIRKIAAYAVIAQLGFVLMGEAHHTNSSFHGAALMMVSHAVSAAMIFLLIGVLGQRAGKFSIQDQGENKAFGGLARKTPILMAFFIISILSFLGMPGLGTFTAKLLIFVGVFHSGKLLTALSLLAIFIMSGYLFWMFRKIFLGNLVDAAENYEDMTIRERVAITPLLLVCVLVGTVPSFVMNLSDVTLTAVLEYLKK